MQEQLSLFDASAYDKPTDAEFGFPEMAAVFVDKVERWLERYSRALTELKGS